MRQEGLQVTLDIELSADPVAGTVVTVDGQERRFAGWVQLLEALDAASGGRCSETSLERARRELLLDASARRKQPLYEGLSRGESRVAELAAIGLSNREIADELFVTVSTVEVHLTSTYRKLGIASRGELEQALRGRAPQNFGVRFGVGRQ